jgi:hypothetical protein
MIVFEEKMRELVALMPNLTDANSSEFPIRYDWGSIDVLNKFLLLKESQSKYPLIWLVIGSNSNDYVENHVTRKARFVIATRSNQVDQFNEFQYKTDFSNVIIPVYQNFITLLEKSGITTILNQKIETETAPNFSFKDDGKGLITVWNALVVDIEIRIDGKRCVNKNIKF